MSVHGILRLVAEDLAMGMKRFAALALVSTIALGACASSEASDESANSATKVTTTTAASVDGFCDQFGALAAQREEMGGGGVRPGSTEGVPDSEEGWDLRIETTTKLANAAPAEYQDEAQTYVELVTARAELFAEHGYPASLADIPAEDTQAFIRDHADEQQIANTFIDFAKTECGVA